MSSAFRILLMPVLLALPAALASLEPLGFFRDPRCLAFFALFVAGLAAENALVDAGSVRASFAPGQRRFDRRSFELSILTNVTCFYAPVWDYFHLPPIVPRSSATLVAGLLLMVAGEGLRVLAVRTLGRFFTMRVAVLDGHRVVREGVYRFVRHPAYSGWLLLSIGVGLFFGSIVGLCGTSLFVVVLGWRVKVEEQALAEQLGDEYRGYMRDVRARFIPGVF
jgi:protein-S-isoprenylcysteine O-methyltransferase Ste14